MQLLKRIPYIGSLVLLVYMPLHIFLVQSLSLLTGGLEVWKVGKDVFLALLVLFTICLVFVMGKANRIFKLLLVFVAIYSMIHLGLWALHPEIYDKSAMLGIIYNMRLPLFLTLGYSMVLVTPKFAFSSLIKILLSISTLVAALGVLQFFLPHDILSHFGYSIERGARYAFFIDDNHNFPRIMATLREPNALGAYLIVPTSFLALLLLRVNNVRKRYILASLFALHMLAILMTFSRSAWVGALCAVLLVIGWEKRSWIIAILRRFWPLFILLVITVSVVVFSQRNNTFVQQYITHTNDQKQNKDPGSNGYHILFIKQGLDGMADQPFGHGPGTAGLASIQNPKGSFLTENYYVQIGYELGLLGLAVFLGLNVWIYIMLWRQRTVWTTALLASFWAYIITNMLLHTWSNEAVAAQWWMLAGIMLGLPVLYPAKKGTKTDKLPDESVRRA